MKTIGIYKRVGQANRSIDVLVFYKNEDVDGQRHGRVPTLEIIVKNDSTLGISSSEIDTGLDTIAIPQRFGDAAKDMRMEIVDQNSGFMRLRCE